VTTSTTPAIDVADRLAGVLLGTAIGDSLGLPMEGMGARAISRRYARLDRYQLLGDRGFVSDDTEQSALVAQSLARHPRFKAGCVLSFRKSILGWFLRLPWGIGFGTLRACLRIAAGFERSGVASAGNGAAMRAAIVGAFFFDDAVTRREWAGDLARVTHTDARAVDGACFVAEVAAEAMTGARSGDSIIEAAIVVVDEPSLREAIVRARALAASGATVDEASGVLGTTGFIVHTIALTTFCFVRFGHDPVLAIVEAIRAGGDTDSNAAIVGAWMGARHGASGLPSLLRERLHDSDWFTTARRLTLGGPSHLLALAAALDGARRGDARLVVRYSWPGALLRNIALYPIVLAHAVRVVWSRAA